MLKVGAEHVAAVLGISIVIASDIVAQLGTAAGTPAMVAIARKMTVCPAGAAPSATLLALLDQSFQFSGLGLDPALVGLG